MQILFTSLYEHWNSEYFFEGANQLIVFIFLLQNKFPIHFRARALLFNFLSARRTKWRASFFFERVFVNHCHWHIVECACVWLQPEESHANDNPIIRASRQLLSCLSWWINVFFFLWKCLCVCLCFYCHSMQILNWFYGEMLRKCVQSNRHWLKSNWIMVFKLIL